MSDALTFHRLILASRNPRVISVAIMRADFPVELQSVVIADFKEELGADGKAADIARSLLARKEYDLTRESVVALFRIGWAFCLDGCLSAADIAILVKERVGIESIAHSRAAEIPACELPALFSEIEDHLILARLATHPEAPESCLVAAYQRILADVKSGSGRHGFEDRNPFVHNHDLSAFVCAPRFPAARFRDEIFGFGGCPLASYAERADITDADIGDFLANNDSNIVCRLISTAHARITDEQWRALFQKWMRGSRQFAGNVLDAVAKFAPANVRDELFSAGLQRAATAKKGHVSQWFMGVLVGHADFCRWDEIDQEDFPQTRAALKHPNCPAKFFLPITENGHDRFSAEIAIENPNFPAELRNHPAFEAALAKKGAAGVEEEEESFCAEKFTALLALPCPGGRLPFGLNSVLRKHLIPAGLADAILAHPEPEARLAYIRNPLFPLSRIADFLSAGFEDPLRMEAENLGSVNAADEEELDDDGVSGFEDDDEAASDSDDECAGPETPPVIPMKSAKSASTMQDDFSDLPLFAA